jgi:hypothetical protein
MILNPHLIVEGNKTFINTHSTKNEWNSNQKPKIDFNQKPPSLDHYRSMTQIQRNVLIKSLYVQQLDRNIFNVLACLHAEIREQKIELQKVNFSFNDEDVRCKFSVEYTNFRIIHPELYGHIDRSTLDFQYYYMFNKFDDKEDNHYLKFIYNPVGNIYGYIEKSLLTNNYQYYESKIDKCIGLYFTKEKEYNEEVVNNWCRQLQTNAKLKVEWGGLIKSNGYTRKIKK